MAGTQFVGTLLPVPQQELRDVLGQDWGDLIHVEPSLTSRCSIAEVCRAGLEGANRFAGASRGGESSLQTVRQAGRFGRLGRNTLAHQAHVQQAVDADVEVGVQERPDERDGCADPGAAGTPSTARRSTMPVTTRPIC